jgi:hypothetical protein
MYQLLHLPLIISPDPSSLFSSSASRPPGRPQAFSDRSSAHSAVILWHAVLTPSCIFFRLERQSASTPLPPAPHHDRGSSDVVAVVVDLIQSKLFVAYTVNETEHDEIVVSNKIMN